MSDEQTDEALLALLPWYLNGRLEATELAQVEALLQRSDEARAELATLQQLAAAVQAQEALRNSEQTLPSDMGWARLQRSLTAQAATPKPQRDWWRPGLAVAAALVVALQIGILARPDSTDSDWRLQSGDTVQQVSGGYRLQIRFVEHAQWQQIRTLLLEVDGLLVDGPSALGVMQIYVPANKHFSDGKALLLYLQSKSVVQHVALLGRGQ